MIRLGVNIDHVATVRQVRRAREPDPVAAALLAILGGADGITVHLREDRRHIQDRDLRLLRETVKTRLNLELAAEPGNDRVDLDGVCARRVVRVNEGVVPMPPSRTNRTRTMLLRNIPISNQDGWRRRGCEANSAR